MTSEGELVQAYTEESRLYDRLLEWAERLPPAGDAARAALSSVTGVLDRIADIEDKLRPAKERFHAAGAKPGPALQSLLTHIEAAIRRLQSLISTALDRSTTQMDALRPELEALTRRQAVQRAYGSAVSPTPIQSGKWTG